jgi:hypothetical protein
MADAPLVPIKASKSKFTNMLAQTATSKKATRHPDFFIVANLTKTPPQAKKDESPQLGLLLHFLSFIQRMQRI